MSLTFSPFPSSNILAILATCSTVIVLLCVIFSASGELDMSSIGEEGSDWDLSSEVAVVTGVGGSSRGSPQAEKEIRCVVVT